MPTYVYRCGSCEHQFEIFQKMSDDPLDTCPKCAARIRRVIHPVGIVFKGSGWYINDSKSSNGSTDTPAATANSSESKDSTPKAESATKTDSDTKSSTKEPAKPAAD